jgi:O-antigen/teichoic acid export membrane protein
MFGFGILGIYQLANSIAVIPSTLLGTVARQITLPLYSRLSEAGRDMHAALRTAQMRSGAATALLIAGLIAVGPTFIRCYKASYWDATWILPMLAIVMMIQIFDISASSLLIARGNSRIYALSNAIKVACLAVFMPVGIYFDNVRGLLVALIVGEGGRYICTGIALKRSGFEVFRRDFVWAMFALIMGFGVNFLSGAAGLDLPTEKRDWPKLLTRIALEGFTVVGCWGLLVLLGWKLGWFKKRDAA